MLIVIVIIGILAAALVPRLTSVQERARDTKRKTDLRNIYNALEIYFVDNTTYPLPYAWASYNTNHYTYSTSTGWSAFISGYMTSVPVDPINTPGGVAFGATTRTYTYYGVYNSPKHTYDLLTKLENPNDPDRCAVQWRKFLNDTNDWCGPYSWSIYDLSPNVKNQ